MASALGTAPKGSCKAPAQTSATQSTAVGSGSRPGNTRMPIETSAPENCRMIRGTPPSGWLK